MLQELDDLGQADYCNVTPAYMAAENGHIECLRLLKKVGCDLGQADNDGVTPAHRAAEGGHEDCLRLLNETSYDK